MHMVGQGFRLPLRIDLADGYAKLDRLTQRSADIASPVAPDSVQPHSAKSVQFDLNPKERSPERHRSPDGQREIDEDKWRDRDADADEGRRSDYRKSGRRRDESPASGDESDTTIELPPRFDERGRRRDDDPLASKLESVLSSLFR